MTELVLLILLVHLNTDDHFLDFLSSLLSNDGLYLWSSRGLCGSWFGTLLMLISPTLPPFLPTSTKTRDIKWVRPVLWNVVDAYSTLSILSLFCGIELTPHFMKRIESPYYLWWCKWIVRGMTVFWAVFQHLYFVARNSTSRRKCHMSTLSRHEVGISYLQKA